MKDMTNLEKYNKIFEDVFLVGEDDLKKGFDNEAVENWDSVRQLSLTTALEDEFDIMFDAEDILALNSYEKGKEILKKYEIEL